MRPFDVSGAKRALEKVYFLFSHVLRVVFTSSMFMCIQLFAIHDDIGYHYHHLASIHDCSACFQLFGLCWVKSCQIHPFACEFTITNFAKCGYRQTNLETTFFHLLSGSVWSIYFSPTAMFSHCKPTPEPQQDFPILQSALICQQFCTSRNEKVIAGMIPTHMLLRYSKSSEASAY